MKHAATNLKNNLKLALDFHYHRNSCTTCSRAMDYLSALTIEEKNLVDARKTRIGPADAVKLGRSVEHIYSGKPNKYVHIDLKADKPSDDELIAALIGPTGNLRAPTIKFGKTLLVGFNQEAYDLVLTDS